MAADLTNFLAKYTAQSMTGAADWDAGTPSGNGSSEGLGMLNSSGNGSSAAAASSAGPGMLNSPLPGIAGVGLTGPSSAVKTSSAFGDGDEPKEALCTPITRMASEFEKNSSGRLIAVNDDYICYSIKGNLIRVIHFVQVTRNKLAAHPALVCDIEFAGRDSNLLASLDVGGTLRVRRIFEDGGACQYATEIEARLPVSSAATRVCWGRPGSNTVAVACDNTVVIMNYQKALMVAEPGGANQAPLFTPSAFGDCGSCASGHQGAVSDVQFSPDYKFLLTASGDGSVRLWQTDVNDAAYYAKPHTSMSCVMNTVAHGGAPVNTAAFVGVPFIGASDTWSVVTGSSNNSVLRLWRTGSSQWSLAHEVVLESDEGAWTNVAVDDSSKFILLANAKQSACHVLHLADDASSFDLLTKWDIAHPILSFIPDTASASGDNAPAQEDYEIRCFCIQTKAISKYTLQPSECIPVVTAAPPKSVTAVEAARAPSPAMPAPANSSKFSQVPTPQPPQPAQTTASFAASLPVPLRGASPSPSSAPPAANASGARAGSEGAAAAVDPRAAAAMEERLLSAMGKLLDAKLEAQKHALARDHDAKLARLMDALTTTLPNAVSAAVEKQQRTMLQELEAKSQKNAVQAGSLRSDVQSLRSALQADTARYQKELIESVSRQIREPVAAAFRSSFEEQIVPGFQAGAQKMFEQIETAVGSRVKRSSAAARPPPPAPIDPKEHLEALVAEKKFDEAMKLTLESRDLDLVTWLCKKVDPGIMHESDLLSQTVLVCLLQQLGTNLETDTKMKLEWLKQIALSIDKSDADIAAYAPQVIEQVQANMRVFQGTDAGRQHRMELSLITRVL